MSAPKSSLSKYRVMGRIFQPPFLPENEIRKRRFGEMRLRRKGEVVIQKVKTDYNDNWWEWEEELGITPSYNNSGVGIGFSDAE